MTQTPVKRRRQWTLRLVTLATVLALLTVFVAENFVVVELRFVTHRAEVRLAWAVLVAAVIGILAGLLLPRPWR